MEVKIKYELEFPIHASPSLLYQYISTPSGLSEWFADNVNSRGEIFTFIWDDSEEKAKLVSKRSGERVKLLNPLINKATGIKMAPINLLLVCDSIYRYKVKSVQVKNNRDSYKLLKGK